MARRLLALPRAALHVLAAPIRRARRTIPRVYWTWRVRRQVISAGPGLHVNRRSMIPGGSVRIGMNCHFNGMYVAGCGGVTIGDNFHSGRDCKIITVNHNYYSGESLPYDATVINRPVSIGDNVWMGDSVIVLPGARIGEGVVIGAGAVVAGAIEDLAVIGGNPARPIKYRDREHYERLKAERRFL